jgi:hypothetical protein
MKLYKITYETEIVILAEDEKEAISNASYYVQEEEHNLMDWELVESMGQIPNWTGCIPYSAYREYNVEEKKCEEFLV